MFLVILHCLCDALLKGCDVILQQWWHQTGAPA